jgi:hypothetical protein
VIFPLQSGAQYDEGAPKGGQPLAPQNDMRTLIDHSGSQVHAYAYLRRKTHSLIVGVPAAGQAVHSQDEVTGHRESKG